MQGRAQPEKLASLRRNAEIVLEAIGMTGPAENETRARANRELVDVLRRSKLFRDYERVFATPDAKRTVIDYARQRFGGGVGEVHVYVESGETVERKIATDGRRPISVLSAVNRNRAVGSE